MLPKRRSISRELRAQTQSAPVASGRSV